MSHIKKYIFILIAVPVLITLGRPVSHACTLWAAAGERVEGRGVMLAKNRDYIPQKSELQLVIPKEGFKYLGIFPVEGGKWRGLVAGINEKGLAIVSATAGSIPRTKRNKGAHGLNEKILTTYSSVDSVLANKMMLEKSHPVFYLIADKRKVAVIEVAPGGETSIGTTENGVLFHTNHYLDEKLLRANETTGKSSLARLNRIRNLLNDHPLRYTVEDFITFSEDAVDGPDDSIWRTGGTPGKERTLASWIIFMPKNGAPELYIKFANPEEPVRVYNMKLDTPFWTEGIN